ncbi:MAG TPA: (d)CMP kinase [Pseudogracilibacillus sp.]|nr:(d)CMP kinase [Pseudogracilibacillus sp.]
MTANEIIRIAIDGPAAAGKSTVAKLIADKLNFVYIDTGAMYRALTLKVIQEQIKFDNEKMITETLTNTKIEFKSVADGQLVFLDDIDVTSKIRSTEVSQAVSHIAQLAEVRKQLVLRQQLLANNHSVVMDGRDIGTTVLPDAEVKVFLIASVDERAQRRHDENIKKGFSSDLQLLKEEIAERDHRDENRKESPLKKAKDAVSIDTTAMSIDDVVEKIIKLVTDYKNKAR